MNLVIVESPTKGKTIQRFLGNGYKVMSSFGHVRDLPKRELGVDTEHDFQPKYVIPLKSKKVISALKQSAKKSSIVILATDEDREGEAIAYHLKEALKLKDYQRIVFHEITKKAIEEALKNPREIDMALVDAQQARRVLDRIVGYKLSPFLWAKIARGLSAGRVQSVSVRLVVEREREIENFTPQEYWSIIALLKKLKTANGQFEAFLVKEGKDTIAKFGIQSQKDAEDIINNLEGAAYKINKVEKKEEAKNPLPPFTTSTLQQEAWKKLRWPAKLTMAMAQNLYERGFITYHRTDSMNLSESSLGAAEKFITKEYGKNYWAGFFRKYKTKSKGAQEAHEAIRPTLPANTPDKLGSKLEKNPSKLYELIWRRFIACQMAQARFDATVAEIEAAAKKNYIYTFRANGRTLKFDGFLKVYPMRFEEAELPPLEDNESLELLELKPDQHFTQPPGRYSEASLIKALEKNGIGRPSTYAPVLSTVQDRNYIIKGQDRKFRPTEIGTLVNDLLVKHFPQIVDIQFTADMEQKLDKIAHGKKEWVPVMKEFYGPFAEKLDEKYKEVPKEEVTEEATDRKCPQCGAPLVIKLGRFGRFYACSKFPECRHSEPLPSQSLGVKCPKCGQGDIVEKRTRKGKIFYGCSNFPICDFGLWNKPTGETCRRCGALMVQDARGREKCSDKNCKDEYCPPKKKKGSL